MLRTLARVLVPAVLVIGAAVALASPLSHSGPVASKTGAPAIAGKSAEGLCVNCHQTFDGLGNLRPNLNLPGGGVEILDLPAEYEAGAIYPIRVRLWSDSTVSIPTRKWGFQLTAVRESDGEGGGLFQLPDADTLQFKAGSGDFASRLYVEHTALGNRDGLVGPIEWTLSWIAPDPPVGTVRFFVAGNAANGNLSPSGDFIYTSSSAVIDHTTPTLRTTWGDLKARYRR
jgi:hypothetical protein